MGLPKDPAENLRWRAELAKRGREDNAVAASLRAQCATDLLFFINLFGYTYNPRKCGQEVLPFITWPFQDRALAVMEEVYGKDDLVIEKSRDMGATWLVLLLFTHRWLYWPHQALALISRSESLVERAGDPDALFSKLDFVLERLPPWLRPIGVRRTELHLENLDNGSCIDGYATTGNVLRGGRKTAALLDEFAAFELSQGYAADSATQHATDCRYFNSTPGGAIGAFYDLAHKPGMQKIRMHWSQHPEKAAGQYKGPDGKLRSPWYDKQCQRTASPALIGRDLDINYAGSVSQFFDSALLDRLLVTDVREPRETGRLEHGMFVDSGDELSLWLKLENDAPPRHEGYVVGVDVATGTGATNSVASVVDRRTGEKVAELVTCRQSPETFAGTAVELAKWFNNAYLIWELNGPGSQFGKRVTVLGYANVYYRQDEQYQARKMTDKPGWSASPQNKRVLMGEYAVALKESRFINRSREALQECRHVVYLPDGTVGNNLALAAADPSGARANHADRPTADALACKGVYDLKPRVEEKPKPSWFIDPRTWEGRRKLAEIEAREKDEW
jgi:hypothetical protein